MSASVERIEGVVRADINFASATMVVDHLPSDSIVGEILRVVSDSGHGLQSLSPGQSGGPPSSDRSWFERNLTTIAMVGSGALTTVGALLAWLSAPEWAWMTAYAGAIVAGGLLVWRRAVVSLRARILDMNVLMSVAVAGAVALGEWGEAATVFFLFALGGWLESRTLDRTRRSIRELMDLSPEVAHVVSESGVLDIEASAVRIGDQCIVRPGERLPLDGVVTEGESAVDESPITGESAPVLKALGDGVFAGTLNTSSVLTIRATAVAADSTLARIVYLVEEAQGSRAPSQTFIERFSRWYTPTVIWLAVAVATVVPLTALAVGASWGSWEEWIRRALVMLVVSCPCALVISTPVSIVSAISRASRDGVLVKGGAFLEVAGSIKVIAFDKTGTLTRGRAHVAEVVPVGAVDRDRVIEIAGALERHSNHAVAEAIRRAAGDASTLVEVEGFEERPGVGVRGLIGGTEWELCSPTSAAQRVELSPEVGAAVADSETQGHTTLLLLESGIVAGVVGVADEVRPEARTVTAQLRRGGIEHIVMLTGDNDAVAGSVATEIGLTGFHSRLLPAAKVDAVNDFRSRHGKIAMVGDGVNDAPALAAADIGIAMGAAGTDTALETADVALMRDDLRALPGFFALGRRTVSTIRVNVAFSIIVKAVFLVLALSGTATLWMAVFADTGVSLMVILNGMRLMRHRATEKGF